MRALFAAILIVWPLAAQSDYRKHNFTAGMAAGLPRGEIEPFLQNSFAAGFGYGFRFHRYFQADVGLDTVFGAARIREFYESALGPLRIRDYQFLLPFGGRAILPLADDKLLVYGGGGPAYLRYQERLRQPFVSDYYRIDCPVCRARSGWGYYGLLGASVALDRGRHFRVGFSSRVYRAETSGDAFGDVPAITTKDRWVNVMGEFTFAF